jgi:hypothetical protein
LLLGVFQGMPQPCSDDTACNDAYKKVYVQYKMTMESFGMFDIASDNQIFKIFFFLCVKAREIYSF